VIIFQLRWARPRCDLSSVTEWSKRALCSVFSLRLLALSLLREHG